MSGTTRDHYLENSTDAATWVRRLRVEVESTAKPEAGPEPNTYRCDAAIRVTEEGQRTTCPARLTVHHPRAWMGVEARFVYDLDSREFPTFAARAEQACLQVIQEFPSDEIISVFLLGTGEAEFTS
ncbi:MAG: hypothetical protein HKN80_00740 [Acidimicrobiia bacterium]|nr:hypothetical protein [Acidimicrobiia bacterium]